VAIIARVPLASGLLSGRYAASTTFSADDHRNYNRTAPRSTSARRSPVCPTRWGGRGGAAAATGSPRRDDGPVRAALDHRPARRHGDHPRRRIPEQANGNAAAADLAPLGDEVHAAVREVYDELIRPMSTTAGSHAVRATLSRASAGDRGGSVRRRGAAARRPGRRGQARLPDLPPGGAGAGPAARSAGLQPGRPGVPGVGANVRDDTDLDVSSHWTSTRCRPCCASPAGSRSSGLWVGCAPRGRS